MLFLALSRLTLFSDARCIGFATNARSQNPAWMDKHLKVVFSQLRSLGAPILHYKVCSTFDSSPDTGSIGRAIDIGTSLMPAHWSPMIVGAPRLKRFQAFGNLFAVVGDGPHSVGYRLDRHPTMSRHPVTPMVEADLRRHLAHQTGKRLELVDFTQLRSFGSEMIHRLSGNDKPVILVDVVDEVSLADAGRLVWQNRGNGLFSASSSGLPYALVAHWREMGFLPLRSSLPTAQPVDVIAAVSGSCSPMAASQISWARANGFSTLHMNVSRVLSAATAQTEIERLVSESVIAIQQGQSPLVFSAEGPDDPSVTGFDDAVRDAGVSRADGTERIGKALAKVMCSLLDRVPRLRRIVLAGGDSSGMVAQELGVAALSVISDLTPGAPLCRTWSDDASRDGLEVVLKGGQMGAATFYGDVLKGKA